MASQSSTPGRIFIVGCPRSGTTLLQSMLTAHSDLISFPESKFFLFLVSVPEERSRRYAMGLIAPRLKPSLEKFLDDINHPELKRTLPRLPLIRLYTRRFVRILDDLARESHSRFWLEKTPDHLRSIHHIERYVPDAKVIHIVRNGEDVIASLYDLAQTYPDLWGRYYKKGLDSCIQRWVEDIELTQAQLHKPHHFLVNYDHLVQAPREVLTALCEFLGLDLQEQMLENHGAAASGLIRDREAWKSRVTESIQTAKTRKFTTVLTPEQQQHVQQQLTAIAPDQLKSLGLR